MCEKYDGCSVCYRDAVKHDKLLSFHATVLHVKNHREVQDKVYSKYKEHYSHSMGLLMFRAVSYNGINCVTISNGICMEDGSADRCLSFWDKPVLEYLRRVQQDGAIVTAAWNTIRTEEQVSRLVRHEWSDGKHLLFCLNNFLEFGVEQLANSCSFLYLQKHGRSQEFLIREECSNE
jgi:hypothetical protein